MARSEEQGYRPEPGLDRYVRSLEGPGELHAIGKDGLLRVHAYGSSARRPKDSPYPVAELAGDPSSFVLVAPAGAGKSTVLAALGRHEPRAVSIDLHTCVADTLEEALEAALTAAGPIYLDGLDMVWPDAELARILERQLATLTARQVTCRLACRPAAWHAGLAQVLGAALEGVQQLQLLPLDRKGVREVAAGVGADPKAFLEAVTHARLGGLAATPQALRTAAEQWQPGRRLRDDSLDAVRFQLNQWLPGQQAGPGRPPVAAERQQRIARRLGAIAVFSQAQGFALSDRGDDGAVSVAELPTTPEPGEPDAPVTVSEYRSVLDSALFGLAGQTMVFRDRRHAQFLAAAYLVERRVDPQRVHSLLGVQDDGRIPPTTVGVAAWLTALDPQLTADLVAANAVALAGVGLDFPDDDVKATIAGHLLDGATLDTVGAARDLDVTPLAYAGLTDHLERWLEAGIDQPERLWWVARLAGAGGCRRLVAPLLAHALDPGWPSWARGAAVAVVGELGEPGQLDRLRGLLHASEREDPDDELLGHAVTALYPDVVPTEEMLAALRPPRNLTRGSAYRDFLFDVGAMIPDRDLGVTLAWLGEHVGRFRAHDRDDFDWLAEKIVERAWEVWTRTGSEPLLVALAGAVARIMTACGLSTVVHGPPPWFHADPARRRPLAVAVAEQLGAAGNCSDLQRAHLVEPEDTAWLLEIIPTVARPTQLPLVASLSRPAHWWPTRDDAERVLALPVDHPAYEATARLREPCPLEAKPECPWRLPSTVDADRRRRLAPGRLGPALRGWRGWPRKLTLRALDELAAHTPTVAAAVCRRLHGGHDAVATRAAQLLCRLDPSAVVRDRLTTDPCDDELVQLVPLLETARLDLGEVADLSEVLLDRFPIADSPSPMSLHFCGLRLETRSARDRIRQRLVRAGAVESLERLMPGRPEADLVFLRREARRARQVAADQALVPLEPGHLLDCLTEPDGYPTAGE